MEPDQQELDHHAGCVIVQRYSSDAFVSLRFHRRKENFDSFRCISFIFENFLSVKSRNEKLHIFGRICA